LHCIALHCIALHCIALHCIALHCIALHCMVSYRIVSYRMVSYRIVLYRTCIAMRSGTVKSDRPFYCTNQYVSPIFPIICFLQSLQALCMWPLVTCVVTLTHRFQKYSSLQITDWHRSRHNR